MLAAHALRMIRPDRIVVMLDETQSVIELHLKEPLTPDQIAKARCYMTPLMPVPVIVIPGQYNSGVFWNSSIGPIRFQTVVRPRVQYGRPPVKRDSIQASI